MLQQTSKQETAWEFAEIWVDTLISPPYILMLVKEQSGKFSIHNPAQNYKIIVSPQYIGERVIQAPMTNQRN
ncbi:MAG: hypothetical protein AN485_17990 [Anabaena sp. MDT14b]|nr:MAG: hypothetical protein AN485_17990 [Anabaena sp. MDT14b]